MATTVAAATHARAVARQQPVASSFRWEIGVTQIVVQVEVAPSPIASGRPVSTCSHTPSRLAGLLPSLLACAAALLCWSSSR